MEKVPPQGQYWRIPRATFAHSLYKSGKTGDGRDYNTVLLAQHQTYQRQAEQFLAGNPNDAEKAKLLTYLADAYRQAGESESYQQFYLHLQRDYQHVRAFDYYNKTLSASKLPVGSAAPDFSIADLSQSKVNYSKAGMKGKVVLLDFWATWCAPCLKEMPVLHQTYAQFNDKGFEILSLSADEVAQDVINYQKGELTMPWKHGFLQNGKHPIKGWRRN
jgi:thiol-disulfide isomerase/thioredoxin